MRSHSCSADLVSFFPHRAAQHIYVQIAPITMCIMYHIKEEWLNTPPKGRQRHPLPCSGCDKVKRFTHGTLQGGTVGFEFALILTKSSIVLKSGRGRAVSDLHISESESREIIQVDQYLLSPCHIFK